jgi:histidinol phosphatase-like PHP family hydrolase
MHTTLTDGELTVSGYFDFAARAGVDSLVFLEHIRAAPQYNVATFVKDVAQNSETSGIAASAGFEAKLLPGGALDISDRDIDLAAVIGIAEHGFPGDAELLKSSFVEAIRVYPSRFPQTTFVWVHPGLWFRKRGIDPAGQTVYREMQGAAVDGQVLIERNLRYGLATAAALRDVDPRAVVCGADAQRAGDLAAWEAWR